MSHQNELDQSALLSRRIVEATRFLFPEHAVALHIQHACSSYDQQCHDIVVGRGFPMLTITVIGAKGQGKTWIARQFVLDNEIRQSLPSGVLAREATTQLYWIGSVPPEAIDLAHEKFVYCPPTAMMDLGLPYMLLDTPGSTDANPKATEIAHAALTLSPIQLLVIRRDQLRSATTSPLAERSEGVICVPVITNVPKDEWKGSPERTNANNRGSIAVSASLQKDLDRWLKMVQDSAPQSQVLEAILISDFEATGDERSEGDRLRQQLQERLKGQPLETLAKTTSNRLSAAAERLKHQVHRLLQTETPQLSRAVFRLQDEAKLLPRRAIESVLGSPIVLETAIRARMRAQIVADTSPLCFPYRTTLALLCFTHGAWDRLILAMTGSIPSVFGTLVAWARNVQQSRKIEWDMQQGLRERLNGQVQDQLAPIQYQFHLALASIRGQESVQHESHPPSARLRGDEVNASELSSPVATMRNVRLNGIDELQSRSRMLFEQTLLQHRPTRWILLVLAAIGMAIFWCLIAGPIVSVYRHYVFSAYSALTTDADFVLTFNHPSLPLLITSAVLSFIPMLLYAMVAIACLLKRSKIERLARGLQAEHHALVEDLQQNAVLRLEYEDPSLEQAQYLLALDRKGYG